MIVNMGLPEQYFPSVADLFLDALGEKMLPILKDKERAKKLLILGFNSNNCFYAEEDNVLLGFLAFKTFKSSFNDITIKDFISIYGIISGIIKAIKISVLSHNCLEDEVYIEAIAVNDCARGNGVGSMLIESLLQYSRRENYKYTTLHVIDNNTRAMKLYETLGFINILSENIWPINIFTGWKFKSVIFMKYILNGHRTTGSS